MDLQDCVDYATRVAFNMGGSDPELESIANEAAWYAYSSYRDPQFKYGTYSEQGWVARVTKHAIWGYWRKLNASKRSMGLAKDEWLKANLSSVDDEVNSDFVTDEEWRLLCERYVDKWPADVIARRHGWTIAHTKRAVDRAVEKFVEASILNDLRPPTLVDSVRVILRYM